MGSSPQPSGFRGSLTILMWRAVGLGCEKSKQDNSPWRVTLAASSNRILSNSQKLKRRDSDREKD